MYDNWPINILVVVVTVLSVAMCVSIHYEGLQWLSGALQKFGSAKRRKVLYGVYAVICLHVIEIWLFGIAYWALLAMPETGTIEGLAHGHIFDFVYLSATTYTTVGFGDISPVGPIRFVAGTEALIGFILLTWSASFLYLEMERFWTRR
ncbi:MAG TPA: potassium channel family protein [Steroidobacteraceae bacterium]|nr:potassium channel family protein [Steroidobacteraceae bacterium]HRX90937.1 potassium channel family protein [Steroidobacteraceae bacterium]